ncbi:hypothetical protein DFJ74DRAFT_704228 [Hyaloraphidium curvatum]|nr:hypothetical protein DFJ74DRAFT_704228 [Hyaloraphidium curvatum]
MGKVLEQTKHTPERLPLQRSGTPTATFTVLATNAAGDAPVTPTAYTFTATGRVGYTPVPPP